MSNHKQQGDEGVDWRLFTLINSLAGRSAAVDSIMKIATETGPFVYAGLLVLAWFLTALPPGAGRREYRVALLRAALAGVLALAVNWFFSAVYYRPRPFVARPGEVHLLLSHAPDSSVPSDHAALGAAVTTGVWPTGRRWLNALFFAWTVLVAISRVFVGHHYPSDVFAGLLIGMASGMVMWGVRQFVDRWLAALVAVWDRLWPQ